MSLEAMTWAMTFAPIPFDSNGKPNPACASALIGLANHADPDGTAAFPSVRRLCIYTRLSERTVRTALDRLEAAGTITPCDPERIRAKIKRADKRPNGWDLNVRLLRTDLDDDDITLLSDQYPWLPAAIQQAREQGENNGVQQLHPADGVQPPHPADPPRGATTPNGVQQFPERGAAVAPEPSTEPSMNPPIPSGLGGAHASVPARVIPDEDQDAQGGTPNKSGSTLDDAPARTGTPDDAAAKPGRKRSKAARPLPEDWAPTAEMLAKAAVDFPGVDLKQETEMFRDHHLGKGSEWKDWNRSWRKWMRETHVRQTERQARYMRTAPAPALVAAATDTVDLWWEWVQSHPDRRAAAVGRDREYLMRLVCSGLEAGADIDRVKAELKRCWAAYKNPVPEWWQFRKAMSGQELTGRAGQDKAAMFEEFAERAKVLDKIEEETGQHINPFRLAMERAGSATPDAPPVNALPSGTVIDGQVEAL